MQEAQEACALYLPLCTDWKMQEFFLQTLLFSYPHSQPAKEHHTFGFTERKKRSKDPFGLLDGTLLCRNEIRLQNESMFYRTALRLRNSEHKLFLGAILLAWLTLKNMELAGRLCYYWTILKNINYCKTQPSCCRGQVTHPALVRALLPPWSPVFAQHSRAANALQPALPNLNMRKQQASTKEPSFFNSLLPHWGTVETQRELMLPASQGFSMGDQVHPAPPAALGASLLPEDAHHKLQPTVKEASRLAALQWKASCILKTNLRAEKRKLIWQTEIPNVTSVISFWEKYLHCSWTQTKLHQQRFSVCFLMILP